MRYYYRINSLSSDHVVKRLFVTQSQSVESLKLDTLIHKSPFVIRAMRTCLELELPLNNAIEDFQGFIFPPWLDPHEFINTHGFIF